MFKELAQYVAPKRKAIEMSGADGEELTLADLVNGSYELEMRLRAEGKFIDLAQPGIGADDIVAVYAVADLRNLIVVDLAAGAGGPPHPRLGLVSEFSSAAALS